MTSRRRVLHGALFALASLACVRSAGSQPGRSGADPATAALARMASDGRLDGCEIEYWTGGGLPPPHYRSEQFRVHPEGGRDVMEVARPRYDLAPPPDAGPGYPVERRTLDASAEDVRAIARALLDAEVFMRRFPEEDDPHAPDALSTEVIVTVGGRAYQRRYFRRLPEALARARAEVERRVRSVDARGRRGVYHRGQRMP